MASCPNAPSTVTTNGEKDPLHFFSSSAVAKTAATDLEQKMYDDSISYSDIKQSFNLREPHTSNS